MVRFGVISWESKGTPQCQPHLEIRLCEGWLTVNPLGPYFLAGKREKYINIPSEKYIYVHIYVYICVYTYLCKMDEYRSHTILSSK